MQSERVRATKKKQGNNTKKAHDKNASGQPTDTSALDDDDDNDDASLDYQIGCAWPRA